MEFKVDPADGTTTLMEVNGRYWGSISLPLLAGMDCRCPLETCA